jgi:hypothetical protein
MSHPDEESFSILDEEPVTSCYMSCFDVTFNGKTETSCYMFRYDGVPNRKLESTTSIPSRAHSNAPSNGEGK